MLTLKGRTAIITGGSRGIGYAISKEFAKNLMNVGILSVNEKNAKNAENEISKLGLSCIGIKCDVRDLNSIKNAIDIVNEKFGSVDVVVNSAGVLDTKSIEEMSFDHWDKIMSVNLRGTFFVTQQAIPFLEKSFAPRIINLSSNAGRMGGYENGLAYSASKGGIISLTYGLARRLADKRITVNCIAPGTISTEMALKYDDATTARLLSRFPLGRFGKPEEIAALACYLASEEAGFTTGAVIDVNGGMFMG